MLAGVGMAEFFLIVLLLICLIYLFLQLLNFLFVLLMLQQQQYKILLPHCTFISYQPSYWHDHAIDCFRGSIHLKQKQKTVGNTVGFQLGQFFSPVLPQGCTTGRWSQDAGSRGEAAIRACFFHQRNSMKSQSEIYPQFPRMFSMLKGA